MALWAPAGYVSRHAPGGEARAQFVRESNTPWRADGELFFSDGAVIESAMAFWVELDESIESIDTNRVNQFAALTTA